jgi:hypothetical protein
MHRSALKYRGLSLAAIVTGLIAAVAFAAPANADIYLYQDANYSGGVYVTSSSNYSYHDGDTFSNGVRLADNVSSIYNYTYQYYTFYTDHYYAGESYYVSPWAMISYVGSNWNDRFSSHHVL